jgi:hypothetical protein
LATDRVHLHRSLPVQRRQIQPRLSTCWTLNYSLSVIPSCLVPLNASHRPAIWTNFIVFSCITKSAIIKRFLSQKSLLNEPHLRRAVAYIFTVEILSNS